MTESGQWHYRICGLGVASELELPGAASLSPTEETDVVVRRGVVPEDLSQASKRGPSWAMARDRFLLSVPSVARFLVTAGRDITFEMAPGKSERDAAIFLLGSALSILLHQRRCIVVHASAVSVGGRAVLFGGPSGAGKSTLAAAFGARGYPLVNDDMCCIGLVPGEQPSVFPDGRLLKLWEDALDHLKLGERRGEAVRTEIRKFYVPAEETVASPLPIAAFYLLREERPPFKRGIERPNIVDAAQVLRRSAHRPTLIARMGLDQDYFAVTAELQRAAGVFLLTTPHDFRALPEAISMLEAHWRDMGLLDIAA